MSYCYSFLFLMLFFPSLFSMDTEMGDLSRSVERVSLSGNKRGRSDDIEMEDTQLIKQPYFFTEESQHRILLDSLKKAKSHQEIAQLIHQLLVMQRFQPCEIKNFIVHIADDNMRDILDILAQRHPLSSEYSQEYLKLSAKIKEYGLPLIVYAVRHDMASNRAKYTDSTKNFFDNHFNKVK